MKRLALKVWDCTWVESWPALIAMWALVLIGGRWLP